MAQNLAFVGLYIHRHLRKWLLTAALPFQEAASKDGNSRLWNKLSNVMTLAQTDQLNTNGIDLTSMMNKLFK